MTPEIEIDAIISFAETWNPKFLRILKQFSPFGPENMTPVFLTNNLVDTGQARVVGSKHLKFGVIPLNERFYEIPSIGFQLGNHYDNIRAGKQFSICYHIEENFWNGKTEYQLNVKDIHFDQA